MSRVYVSEPTTRGKVVMETSLGLVDIELWPKESPKATRNFVQLCLDGFYDNCSFHRVIPNFIAQAGDPLANGEDVTIYDEPFENEFHSRLHFSHRGLVACAGTPRDRSRNAAQFFITLDSTPELENKHTIFGKVVGNTIYNILRMNEMALLEGYNDRLTIPPIITSAKVVWNPFDDVFPRGIIWPHSAEALSQQLNRTEKTHTKAIRSKILLSFEDDDEEDPLESHSQVPSPNPNDDAKPNFTTEVSTTTESNVHCKNEEQSNTKGHSPIQNADMSTSHTSSKSNSLKISKKHNPYKLSECDIQEQLEWESKMKMKKMEWEKVEKKINDRLEKRNKLKKSENDDEDVRVERDIQELKDPHYKRKPSTESENQSHKSKLKFKNPKEKSHHKSIDSSKERELSDILSAYSKSLKK